MATGDLKVRYDTAIISGFVRCNGRTIGSASSGATEFADATAQALFTHLWTKDSNLAMFNPGGGSTTRGASASADWLAPKQIALPDWRGRALAALDDMGNTAAGRLTATYFGTGATTLGAAGGNQSATLSLAQLPTGITATNTASFNIHVTGDQVIGNNLSSSPSGGTSTSNNGTVTPTATGTVAIGGVNVTSNNTGGGAHGIVSPLMLATVYLKL
jgi:hypothetical protein